MRFESSAEVIIPAHKTSKFRALISSHASSEHGFRSVEFSHVSVRKVESSPGGHAIVKVLLDATGDENAIDDASEAAEDTIAWALLKVGADAHIDVTTRAVG